MSMIRIVKECDAHMASAVRDESFEVTKCMAPATIRYRGSSADPDAPWPGLRCERHAAWLAPEIERRPIE